jgi:hypothetical protein
LTETLASQSAASAAASFAAGLMARLGLPFLAVLARARPDVEVDMVSLGSIAALTR